MNKHKVVESWSGIHCRHYPGQKSQLGPGLWTTQEPKTDWLTEANPPLIYGFLGGLCHTCTWIWSCIHLHLWGGTFALPRYSGSRRRHTGANLHIPWSTSLLDWSPGYGGCKKVDHCDIWSTLKHAVGLISWTEYNNYQM